MAELNKAILISEFQKITIMEVKDTSAELIIDGIKYIYKDTINGVEIFYEPDSYEGQWS